MYSGDLGIRVRFGCWVGRISKTEWVGALKTNMPYHRSNSGPCACKSCALATEPSPEP